MKSERFEYDGKVYWTQTPVDEALYNERLKRHTPGSVWCYPLWTPRNWWRNHFRKKKLIQEETHQSIQNEDDVDLARFQEAVDQLKEDMVWNGSTD